MKKRKLRWYNKLAVLFKETFVENVDYSQELKNKLRFPRFLYNQKFILFLITLPVIILSAIFIYFYKNPLPDNSVFDLNFFDAAAVIATYLGTTFLAVIVWHNTWLQKREKENESAIRVHTEIEINMESGNCIFQQNDISKIKINITNQNNSVPIKIKFSKAFALEKTKVSPIQPRLVSYESDDRLVSFNETEKFSIGFTKEQFVLPKRFYFGFHISNAYGHQVFCIVHCYIDESGWCSDIYENSRLIEVCKFRKLKEEFGYDFLKEVVWYSPVGWKKKFINRVYLLKNQRAKGYKQHKKKRANIIDSSTTKEAKGDENLKYKTIRISILIICIVCLLLLIADGFDFFSYIGVPVERFNGTLISAVVTIISSIIAGALTLFGVYLTIEYNKSEKTAETKRLVMPMLKISQTEYEYKWKYIQFDFNFTEESKSRERKDIENTENISINIQNVGQRELYELYLAEFESTYFDEGGHSYAMHPIVYAGDSININFGLYEKGVYDSDSKIDIFDTISSPISFSCYFKDCLGTCYKQQFTITLFHKLEEGCELNQKALSVSIDRIMIDSAPQEVTKEIFGSIAEHAVQCGGQ